MSYDRTLLFSASQSVSSCTLTEPASAFEHIVIGCGDGRERECTIKNNSNYLHIPLNDGSWSAQAYMVWPYSLIVTNGTKNINLSSFQLLFHAGTENNARTFGSTGNYASNIKKINYVYGVNTKKHSLIPGLGYPGEGWREYDETLLWSANDSTQIQNIMLLSQPVSSFERLKIKTGKADGIETTYTYEVGVPVNSTAWLPLESYWGNSVNSYYFSLHRYRFSGYDKLMPISGKSFQLGTAANNPYTATGNYTGTGIYIRYPVNQIWGINSKY